MNIIDKLACIKAMEVPDEPAAPDNENIPSWDRASENVSYRWRQVMRRDAIIAKQRAVLEVCESVVALAARDVTMVANTGTDPFSSLRDIRALLAAIKEMNK